jgi:predicted aldo/keto reductase-like oxidoreductase
MKGKSKSTAETAMRFVLSNPGVNIALSGMGTLEMVDENAAIASQSGLLTDEDKDAVLQMMNENRRLSELYCTGCNYCQPCPQGIVIPRLFELMNYHKVYGITGYAKSEYKSIMDGTAWNKSKTAVDCVECGLCESKCPQKLAVVNQLKETHEALAV